RRAGQVAEGGLVESIDEIAALLKFNRQKERGRGVDAQRFGTSGVRAAGRDLVHPEVKTGGVRLAIEKNTVMLDHESVRQIDLVGRDAPGIAENGEPECRRGGHPTAGVCISDIPAAKKCLTYQRRVGRYQHAD